MKKKDEGEHKSDRERDKRKKKSRKMKKPVICENG